ncbi:ArsR family transcriptional regulator [Brevibacterium sp. p3-SID960]|nr:helix-turn-helix domain-containing protein [Brevibacterium sp. p3-SID960]MCT1691623.1 ArsR family transcriptional regulator [Brevibacterium sp. p3-SID960]
MLTKDGRISVAAYVLFARRPQTIFPSAHVRVLKYLQNERGAGRTHAVASGSDVRCEGSLPSQISEAADAIAQMIPHRHALGDSGRLESLPIIPGDAWLESLVNAVVHRSYSISGDHVRVEIFPIESTSQARAGSPAWPTLSRPNRSAAMRALPESAQISESQELGEGIRRIFAEMRRTGLSEPMYVQSSQSVRLTLLARSSLPSSIEEALGPTGMKIFKAMRQAQRPLGTGQIAELVGMTRPTVLRHLTRMPDAEIVTWRGEQPKDPHATWRLN